MNYEINDIFYSIQGEGLYTGEACIFIRLSGCNKNCIFCDTNHEPILYRFTEEQIYRKIRSYLSNHIIITGGEPLVQDVAPLVYLLRKNGYIVHLETNGTILIPRSLFHWIAMCPKDENFEPSVLDKADEIKILAGLPSWKELAQSIKERVPNHKSILIMPLTGNYEHERIPMQENVNDAIQFCLDNPRFKLCPQVHKLMNFK